MPDVRVRTEDDVLQEGGCKWKGEVNITDMYIMQAFLHFRKNSTSHKTQGFIRPKLNGPVVIVMILTS